MAIQTINEKPLIDETATWIWREDGDNTGEGEVEFTFKPNGDVTGTYEYASKDNGAKIDGKYDKNTKRLVGSWKRFKRGDSVNCESGTGAVELKFLDENHFKGTSSCSNSHAKYQWVGIRKNPIYPDSSYFLTEIPGIMRKKGWDIGAEFLSRWLTGAFNRLIGKASEGKGSNGPLDIEEINLDWVVKNFSRANSVYQEMVKPSVYANIFAQKVLKSKINDKLKRLNTNKVDFGDIFKKGRALEKEYCNYRIVKSYTLDALTAALGNFTFYVIPKGQAEKNGTEVKVVISEIGVYIRDCFDFEGSQPLGWWKLPNLVSAGPPVPPPNPEPAGDLPDPNFLDGWFSIENADFQRYRNRTSLGRDFLIYSDVKVTKVEPPFIFKYN